MEISKIKQQKRIELCDYIEGEDFKFGFMIFDLKMENNKAE